MGKRFSQAASLILLGIVITAPRAARAALVRNELDSAAALSADGWSYIQEGGTATYSGSLLRLQTSHGYNEFLLRDESDKPPLTTGWVGTADAGRGWWFEVRLRVAAATNCVGGGPGISVSDDMISFRLLLDGRGAHYFSGSTHDIPVASMNELHTYRIQNLGGRHVQVLIDGVLVADEPTFPGQGAQRELVLGDLGACDATDATWDYVAYDTFGPSASPGDADQDGVDNASDNCALIANADQKNSDGDAAGDACDLCPQDAQNDQDRDGLCGDVDVCPNDARNDRDNNGVCDTMQCAPYQNVVLPPGSCPAICFCQPFGNDPIGGFGNLGNIGGNYGLPANGGANAGGASAGSTSAGASSGTTANGGAAQGGRNASPTSQPVEPAAADDAAGCTCVATGAGPSHAPASVGLGALGVLALGRRRRLRRRSA